MNATDLLKGEYLQVFCFAGARDALQSRQSIAHRQFNN
jgi:hypothetical protein